MCASVLRYHKVERNGLTLCTHHTPSTYIVVSTYTVVYSHGVMCNHVMRQSRQLEHIAITIISKNISIRVLCMWISVNQDSADVNTNRISQAITLSVLLFVVCSKRHVWDCTSASLV